MGDELREFLNFSYVTCEWMLDDDNIINESITMRIYVYVYI